MKKLWRSLQIILIIFLVSSMTLNTFATTDEIEKAKKEQQNMEKKLKETENKLTELAELKKDSQEYIKKMDAYLDTVSQKVYSISVDISNKNAEIEETKKQIEAAEISVNSQYEAMKLRIKFLYENGEASYISMILESKDMSELLNRAEYLSQITEYDRNMLTKLQETRDTIQAKKVALDAQLLALSQLEADAKAEEASVEKIIAAKTESVNQTTSELTENEKLAKQQKAEIEAQEKIIAELVELERKRKEEEERRKAQNQKLVTYDGGTLSWPVPGYSKVSSEYGSRISPINGKQENHSGIDIPAPSGTNIISAYNGEVIWAYYSSSAGNWVGIDHGNGLSTVYMHMSKMLVKEGDIVKKGDVIGLVGSTGWSTGAHLHFSVRLNGSYVSPRDYVSP